MKTKNLVAPCGIDCVNCELYCCNFTEETKSMLSKAFKKDPADIVCRGCRTEGKCMVHGNCQTLDCVKKKGVEFCYECAGFPCSLLQPMADGADKYPHNMKVYNLCRIKKAGLEKFILEEAPEIRRRYYHGRFLPGAGPQL